MIAPQRILRQKRNEMTLAMGVWCNEGVVIASDQSITRGGIRTYERKIGGGRASKFSFALAYSSEDAVAGKTLLDDITESLKTSDAETLAEIKEIVRSDMASWQAHYAHQTTPQTHLVLGVSLSANTVDIAQHALFRCEPPQTIQKKELGDDSRGFTAIGAEDITSHFHPLFGEPMKFRNVLFKIAYLMKKAKTLATYVGGSTDVLLLPAGNLEPPIQVSPWDMENAEELSTRFDHVFSQAVMAILSPNEPTSKIMVDMVSNFIRETALRMTVAEFRSIDRLRIIE
jgi:hypothetical protein